MTNDSKQTLNKKKTQATTSAKLLKGTFILTISSIIVKIIGSLNWIILSRIMGGEGIGIYQMGFPIYLMAITVSSAGIPVAISIITSEKLAKKDFLGAKRIFSVSLRLLFVTGLVFSLLLFFGASWLIDQHWIRDPRAYYSIIALAPAVFFVTFLSSFRGYLQGWQIMTPTAVSEIVEQLMRVLTMIFFAQMFLPYGLKYAAGGASMGAGVGAFCALCVLTWFYTKLKKQFQFKLVSQNKSSEVEPAFHIIKRLLKLALPVSLSSLMLPIVANLDLLIVPTRLGVAGYSISQSTELFGYLTGMAVPLVNLASIFTAAMAINLVPAISQGKTLNDLVGIKAKTSTAFKVTAMISIPSSIGLYTLADKISTLIYNAPNAAPAIQIMSLGIFMLGLHQISTGILQGLGKTRIPVQNMIIAAALKVVFNWHFTALPAYGIKGAAFATVIDFSIAACLNLYFIHKYTGFKLPIINVLKSLFSALVMGASVKGVLYLTPNAGMWNIFLAILVAILVYAITILAIGGLDIRSLKEFPFIGSKLLSLLQKFGFFKENK